VTAETVPIPSGGDELEALLYVPETAPPHPCVVMAGGWCYVKELVQPVFAEVFAAEGLASLVFDYRSFGGSTGEPRQHIDPWGQAREELSAADRGGVAEREVV
jgi:dienelactone hydrolase